MKLRLLSLLLVLFVAFGAYAQTGVTAEAIQQANLRATTDVNANLLGQIVAGSRYPVIGRSELYPWVLLGDPATLQPIGWVFRDIVTIVGDLNSVPLSQIEVTNTEVIPVAAPPEASRVPGATSAPTPSPSPTLAARVTGAVTGEINIRYAPGTEYERLGVGRAGEVFEITAWHSQLPWVQIRYPASPNGLAWVAIDLLDIQGDVYSLPAISQMTFALPTLTPTPSEVDSAQYGDVPLSPEFRALAVSLWEQMIAAGFDPLTSRLGSVFVKDLQTGEAFALGDEIAFSGMSVNKIAILTTYYSQRTTPPNDAEANMLAEAMVCSENISTNEMLSAIGSGNPYTGANTVSAFLDQLGFADSFIYTPYSNDPFITPQAPRTETTSADQVSAEPDPFNQMTTSEMGMLLDSLYQCAAGEGGLLIDNFDGEFTQTECAQILNLMSYNRIGALIESGVPIDVRVAHKHGWIEDTHGDAAAVFSPGGDYILVIVLHNPVWLNFDESSLLVENVSMAVYNYFNPDAPMTEPRDETVPATCELLGNPVIEELMSPVFP
ncbi:MAG: serine hydrolase [Anaerolinea sp.]|nr:serine hydrolase [Anaerolinea sp.]